jgi:hypothetical protein
MASLLLRQIERGNVTFAATDTTKTVTLSTTLLDTAKTVLLFSVRANGVSIDHQVLGQVLSTTQIQFERVATPSNGCVVEYEVIEFTQGINVQRIVVSQTALVVSTTITSVDTAKTFAIGTVKNNGTIFNNNDFILYDITSATNINTSRLIQNGNAVSAVQIIQIDDATVQKVSGTGITAGSQNITISSITESNTIFVFSLKTLADPVDNYDLPYLKYIDATTLQLWRYNNPGASYDYCAYVVSIPGGVAVQNINTYVADNNTTATLTITSVIVAQTALNLSGMYGRWGAGNGNDGDPADNTFTLSTLTATSFVATRAAGNAVHSTFNTQVMSFNINAMAEHTIGRGIMRGVGVGIM